MQLFIRCTENLKTIFPVSPKGRLGLYRHVLESCIDKLGMGCKMVV